MEHANGDACAQLSMPVRVHGRIHHHGTAPIARAELRGEGVTAPVGPLDLDAWRVVTIE